MILPRGCLFAENSRAVSGPHINVAACAGSKRGGCESIEKCGVNGVAERRISPIQRGLKLKRRWALSVLLKI